MFCECCHHVQILRNSQGKVTLWCFHIMYLERSDTWKGKWMLSGQSPLEQRRRGTGSGSMRGQGVRLAQICHFFRLVAVMSCLGKILRNKLKGTVPMFFILSKNNLFSEIPSMGSDYNQFGHLFFWVNLHRMLKCSLPNLSRLVIVFNEGPRK